MRATCSSSSVRHTAGGGISSSSSMRSWQMEAAAGGDEPLTRLRKRDMGDEQREKPRAREREGGNGCR